MLTTIRRQRQRRRHVLREVARSTLQEEVACDANQESWAQERRIPAQLSAATDASPPPVDVRPAPRLVGLDGAPLRRETTARVVGPDGRPLRGDGEAFEEEDPDVLELLREEFLEGDDEREADGEEDDPCAPPHRPRLEVADIFRRFGMQYRRAYGRRLSVQQDRALRELMVCRTDVMGSHVWQCDQCGVRAELFNSCNNRHCPKCQTQNRKDWAARLQRDLLPIEYYHVIFTVPRPVTLFALENPQVLYPLLLRAGAEAVLTLGRTWEELQALMALLALLHTWGQLVNPHLHSHSMLPAGGLSLDGRRWVGLPEGVFLPLDQLRALYRDVFLRGLEKAHRRGELVFPEDWRMIESPAGFEAWLAPLREIDWVVRVRSVWDRRGSHDQEAAAKTIDYLSRYANRVAISNSRLIGIEGEEVLFRYKDYRDGNQWKTMRLPGVEFIRRFLLHVLPKGLRHIRRFGFMGPSVHSKNLNRIRELLDVHERKTAQGSLPQSDDSWNGDTDLEDDSEKEEESDQVEKRLCRQCGGHLVLVAETPRPTVAQLMQMPPSMEPLADSPEVQYHLPLSARL